MVCLHFLSVLQDGLLEKELPGQRVWIFLKLGILLAYAKVRTRLTTSTEGDQVIIHAYSVLL